MSARSEIIRVGLFLAVLGWDPAYLLAADDCRATRSGTRDRLPTTSAEVRHAHPRCHSMHTYVGVGGQRFASVGSAQSLIVFSYGPYPSGCYGGVFYWAGPPVCGNWNAPVPWCYSACFPCAFYPPVFVAPPVVYYDPASPILRDLGVLRPTMPGAMLNGPVRVPLDLPGLYEQPHSDPATSDSPPQGAARSDQPERPPAPPAVRTTNSRQHQLAQRFIQFGDRLFREGRFRSAYFQYREAEKAAPDVADTYFRQAFALIATRQYSMAFDALKKGLSVDEKWPTRGFRLALLYGDRDLDVKDHRAELAQAIEENPTNPELLFLLAVHLYCDDRVPEAKEFFRQARTSSSVASMVSLFPGVD